MRARLTVRITPDDVGRRVSVRSRDGDGFTDAVGHLRAWTDTQLVVERRDGTLARIAPRDLVAGKVLPDTPPRPPDRYPAA